MNKALTSIILSVVSASNLYEADFVAYLAQHGKSYKTVEEFQDRLALYVRTELSLQEIRANSDHTFTVKHNIFSDWTPRELAHMMPKKELDHWTPV